MPVYQEKDWWIAECEECGWIEEKDKETSAKMALVRHAAICPAKKKEKAEIAAFEEEVPQTFSELVEQVMKDYGVKPKVIERIKRRITHTDKYEKDPVQFRRLLEGQRLKQSTAQMIVEDVFDEYTGTKTPEPARYGAYAAQPYIPYVTERIIYVDKYEKLEREIERLIGDLRHERLERKIDRIERLLEDINRSIDQVQFRRFPHKKEADH